jgi:hypothetical protein
VRSHLRTTFSGRYRNPHQRDSDVGSDNSGSERGQAAPSRATACAERVISSNIAAPLLIAPLRSDWAASADLAGTRRVSEAKQLGDAALDDIRELLDCSTAQLEYWSHVADQHELPIAPGRTLPTQLDHLDALLRLGELDDSGDMEHQLSVSLQQDPNLLDEARLFAGISDKRLYLALSYEFSRVLDEADITRTRTLCRCQPASMTRHQTSFFKNILGERTGVRKIQAAQQIASFLIRNGIAETLHAYSHLSAEDQLKLLVRLVFVKEAQQNEAKRRGHGAEAAVARVLEFADVRFLPRDKVANPMGAHDPNIDVQTLRVTDRDADSTMSCDLAVLDADGNLRAWVVGLVQSSDPGQFGVDKSATTQLIRQRLDESNSTSGRRIELWGIVDGVGYSENKSGTIDRMLQAFHQFIQVKSAYKAALVAHALGVGDIEAIWFDPDHYSSKTKAQMIERYVASDISVLEAPSDADPSWKQCQAGWAVIFR